MKKVFTGQLHDSCLCPCWPKRTQTNRTDVVRWLFRLRLLCRRLFGGSLKGPLANSIVALKCTLSKRACWSGRVLRVHNASLIKLVQKFLPFRPWQTPWAVITKTKARIVRRPVRQAYDKPRLRRNETARRTTPLKFKGSLSNVKLDAIISMIWNLFVSFPEHSQCLTIFKIRPIL